MRFAFVIALCGCRIGFDQSGVDARTGDAVAEDAGVDDAGPDAAFACTARTAIAVPTSSAISGNVGATGTTAGTCGGPAAEDVYSIDVTVPGSGLLLTGDGSMTSDGTVSMYVRTSCEDAASELSCDLGNGIGNQPEIRLENVATGRYYVYIDGLVAAPYSGSMHVLLPTGAACDPLNQRDRCGASRECSSNVCTPAACSVVNNLVGLGPFNFTANTNSMPNLHAGTCGSGGDGGLRAPESIYTLTLAAPASNVTVRTDNGATAYDTLVYVRDACQGTELACDDDTGTSPANTSIAQTGPVPAGIYYIFIDGFGRGAGQAAVTVTITP